MGHSLSRKHYNAMARIIKGSRTKSQISKKLANFFKTDNPAFDKTRWHKAVGTRRNTSRRKPRRRGR